MTRGRPFAKGVSGNPLGRPKRKLVDAHLTELLEEHGGKRARKIALTLLDKARRGNLKAIEIVCERTEGKAVQKSTFAIDATIGLFLTPDERERRIAELLAKRGGARVELPPAPEGARPGPEPAQSAEARAGGDAWTSTGGSAPESSEEDPPSTSHGKETIAADAKGAGGARRAARDRRGAKP